MAWQRNGLLVVMNTLRERAHRAIAVPSRVAKAFKEAGPGRADRERALRLHVCGDYWKNRRLDRQVSTGADRYRRRVTGRQSASRGCCPAMAERVINTSTDVSTVSPRSLLEVRQRIFELALTRSFDVLQVQRPRILL